MQNTETIEMGQAALLIMTWNCMDSGQWLRILGHYVKQHSLENHLPLINTLNCSTEPCPEGYF